MVVREQHRTLMHSNCDAVEFCDDRKRFVVATYELQETQNVREGSISLFSMNEHSNTFSLISSMKAPAGVLDIKFIDSRGNCDDFFAPLADGSIRFGTVTPDNEIECDSFSEPIDNDIALAICNENELFCAAFSSGHVRQFRRTENEIVVLDDKKIHELEVWAVLSRDKKLYTGSDDCTLRCTDSTGTRILRKFDAGVTAIENDESDAHCILVGTYEDKLYQFDLRNVKQPRQQVNIGGGVWRIKQNPFIDNYFAVAGMYAGGFVIDKNHWTVVDVYDKHESMCYGIAWKDHETLISCSFYDKLLASWKFGIND